MNTIETTAGSNYRPPVEATYTPPPARIPRPDEGRLDRAPATQAAAAANPSTYMTRPIMAENKPRRRKTPHATKSQISEAARQASKQRPQNLPQPDSRPQRLRQLLATNATWYTGQALASALGITRKQASTAISNLLRSEPGFVRTATTAGCLHNYSCAAHNLPQPTETVTRTTTPIAKQTASAVAPPLPAPAQYRDDIMQESVTELLRDNCAWHTPATVAAALEITTIEADDILNRLFLSDMRIVRKHAGDTSIYAHTIHDLAEITWSTLYSQPPSDLAASLTDLEHRLKRHANVPQATRDIWSTTLTRLAQILDPSIGGVLDEIREHLVA